MAARSKILTLLFFLSIAQYSTGQRPNQRIPAGYDALRRWDLWYMQRPGVRAYMRSTYDRAGGNEGADASHFLYMDQDKNVTLDVRGMGILYFTRTNHWHGSPWHYVVDGHDNTVEETATRDPQNATKKLLHSNFIPAEAFPEPLAYTWATTKGADLMWTPIGFTNSLQIGYTRTHYGTGYYIWHQFADTNRLSVPVSSWDISKSPPQDVINLIDSAGQDIAPRNSRSKHTILTKRTASVDIEASHSRLRAIQFSFNATDAVRIGNMQLEITWDHRAVASVHAPLALFFGAGSLLNPDRKEFLVKAFPVNVRFDSTTNRMQLACYFPMPFEERAHIRLIPSDTSADFRITTTIRYDSNPLPGRQSAYFHASYKDFPKPEAGKDLVLVDTRMEEKQSDWSGSFIGTSFIFSHDANGTTLEGDPRFYFDDSQSPQAYGTGTEEWGGGGDYWGMQNMSLPFAGHPCGVAKKSMAKSPEALIESAYRFLLSDLMPFGKNARITLEHGGNNLSTEHYETIAYWYGSPHSTLVSTDSINVGDLKSERAHAYRFPDGTDIDTVFSRYEWGIDSFPAHPWDLDSAGYEKYKPLIGTPIFTAQQKTGRHHRGKSTMRVKIDPRNKGVLIRRTLDYQYPNQTAKVLVDKARAGTWYLAGSNTCVYSNPPGEPDERSPVIQTSNRRLRDDEFLIPAKLTKGKSFLLLEFEQQPDSRQLMPGVPFPQRSAWSELDYNVYSIVE